MCGKTDHREGRRSNVDFMMEDCSLEWSDGGGQLEMKSGV